MKTSNTIVTLILLTTLISCGGEENTDNQVNHEVVTTEKITLSNAQFDNGKMTFGSFSEQSFGSVIHSTGFLDVPPESKSTISAYFGGYVKEISLLEGQKITKGQTLFTLENPAYIKTQQDFLEAKSQLKYLKSDFERQKSLLEGNVSSEKSFLKAESDYKVMFTKYESLKKELQLMNINPDNVTETNLRTAIAVTAPISGYITSVQATKGMFLNPADIALTIIDTDHIHLVLNIFEKDLMQVEIGQDVSFRLQNSPSSYQATVLLINKAIDPQNRTISVHCHLKDDSENNRFTPGMYVEAEISISNKQSNALPIETVVSIEDKSYVLIQKNKTNTGFELERKEVEIGQENGEFIEIMNINEFALGTQFLTKGAFNLIQE